MSEFESMVLFDLAQNVAAWRVLQDPEAQGGLDADGILVMHRRAGYPEEECQKAARQRAEQRLDQNKAATSTVYVHQ